MTAIGRETLPDVWEWSGALSNVRDRSRVPFGCPGVVGKPYPMSAIARVALPDVREWSRGPPGCSGVVGRVSQMSAIGLEGLPDVRDRSGGPP